MADLMNQFMGPETMLGKALSAPSMVFTDTEDAWNRPDLWSAELPAANGITNARSLARFYAGLSGTVERSEEHTSELQSLMRISYAVFCLNKQKSRNTTPTCKIQISN